MQVENTEFRPKIVAFCCNWCSYAGADLAGSSRLAYPADVKIIRVPCSCRVNPMFILRAFQRGADGVILCGCLLYTSWTSETVHYRGKITKFVKNLFSSEKNCIKRGTKITFPYCQHRLYVL